VVTGYTVIFASLQLFAGTFADRFGSKRAYGVGMVIFVVASAACAAAPTLPVLIKARIVQGIGAAAFLTTARAVADRAGSLGRPKASDMASVKG
jgi:DHA2 family methylenomycin A resistance protein-like MFS transporter